MAMHGTAVQLSLGTYVNTLSSVSKYPHKNWDTWPVPGYWRSVSCIRVLSDALE